MPNLPFKATKRMRERVMLLAGTGLGQRGIAQVMGIARSTLEIHFRDELDSGQAKLHARLVEWLYEAAEQGNVAAMKYLDAKREGYVMGTARTLGKKEQQAEAAKVAGVGTEWEADLMRVMPQADDKPN